MPSPQYHRLWNAHLEHVLAVRTKFVDWKIAYLVIGLSFKKIMTLKIIHLLSIIVDYIISKKKSILL